HKLASKNKALENALRSKIWQILENPHPDIYLLTAKLIGEKPEHCIAFEDTLAGVRSAKAAGMSCLAIPNTYTKKQDFSLADRKFAGLQQVLKYLKEMHREA
ncbi:HAD-IA family hydrolase, partial [Candidatus Parvarchaeota archaeon]|nr:HAD-IA family hydrolase [Candidatus Parvarchaeota archaeon]